MSKIFSFVTLTTNDGVTEEGYLAGMPDHDDVEESDLYQGLIEDNPDTEYVTADVTSYLCGEGESESADDEFLEQITADEGFLTQDDVQWTQQDRFVILNQDFEMGGMEL